MAPLNALARQLASAGIFSRGAGQCASNQAQCLDDDGKAGMKILVPAVIGGIFGVAILAGIIVWLIVCTRARKREEEFWKRAEVRNTIRNSRAMALAEEASLATRNSVTTLSTLASGVSGPQVYDSHLLPSLPSERSLRASMMSMNSSLSNPYGSSPLARHASTMDDPWDTRSDADPSEAAPMLPHNRSPRPSLTINTGSNDPPSYGKTYVATSAYPQVVGEPAQMQAKNAAVAAAAAKLEGHDYEYAQAAANAAAYNEAPRSAGGHARATIVSVSGQTAEVGAAPNKAQ